ncbi:RNA polymerase sigma factor SigM [compost metagenome]
MSNKSLYSKEELENFCQLNSEKQTSIYNLYIKCHYKLVYSIVRNHFSTEDILQEAFLRVINKDLTHIYNSKLNSWIYILTKNLALNYLRKHKYNKNNLNIDDVIHNFYVSNPIIEYVKIKNILYYISLLPLNLRKTIYYRSIMQLSYKEISKITGISEGAVKQNLHRARKILREQL